MTIRLKVMAEGEDYPVSAQVELPARGQTFTLSPHGARQLAQHLNRLADMIEQATEGQE